MRAYSLNIDPEADKDVFMVIRFGLPLILKLRGEVDSWKCRLHCFFVASYFLGFIIYLAVSNFFQTQLSDKYV